MITLLHPDGTRVPLLGMRSTRTGALRPPTDEELASLRAQWYQFGNPKVQVEDEARRDSGYGAASHLAEGEPCSGASVA